MTFSPFAATPASPMSSKPSRPLRILEVGSCFPGWGGTEIHVLNLSEQLVKRGHDVTISARPGRFVDTQARARGLSVFNTTIEKQQDWRDSRAYLRFLREKKFDIVHAHWRPDYIVPPTLARLARVPVVLLSHHSPFPLKKKERVILPRLCNRMIALSESVRQMLLHTGLPADFVTTIHHGTDTEAFRKTTVSPETVRAEWGVPKGRFVVGIVGRIAEEKGVTDLMRAVAKLKDLPVHLVIVGDGPWDLLLRHLEYELKLGDRVTFAGFRQDVNNAINALDVLVLASTWAEPCAAVVQQAMALGKPVVGTDMGGTPEMVASGETGLIVPPQNPDALASALRAVYNDPARRAEMGRAGRVRVDDLFTLSGMTDRIESLYYRELAARRGDKALLAPQAGVSA